MQIMKEAKKFVDTNDFSWIDDKYRKSLIKEQEEAAINKGKSLGIAEGKSIGILEGTIKLVKKLIANGYNKKELVKLSGLSEEEIDKLK